ncbi:Dihydroorotate dehydrogenase (quinone), mitochondrial [Sorochytrium milnesiophthora]
MLRVVATSLRGQQARYAARRAFATGTQSAPGWTASVRPFITTTSLLVGAGFFTLYMFDARAGIHSLVTMPLLRATIEPEEAHKLAVKLAKWGLVPKDRQADDPALQVEIWGKKISNPVGLAAGFDKHAEAIDGMFDVGFGTVEIGSVTPKPQPGNAKPRMFRLYEDKACINRYGFNSEGHQVVHERLLQRLRKHSFSSLPTASTNGTAPGMPFALRPDRLLGVNLGKNKSSAMDAHDDYVSGVKLFAPVADYLAINISSPNTPGLRNLQGKELLRNLVSQVMNARNATGRKVPVCVKISPDMSDDELRDVATVALEQRVDGLIVTNTTLKRPETLKSDSTLVAQAGGLSGPPLFEHSLRTVKVMRALVGDRIPIIGCGGISSATEAVAYAKAGATMVQLYTAMAMDGPHVVVDVKDGVSKYLKEHNTTWMQLVGSDNQYQ